MRFLKRLYLFLLLIFLFNSSFLFSMEEDRVVEELGGRFSLSELDFILESDDPSGDESDDDFDPSYDSDSENESNYLYTGFSDFEIPEHLHGRKCLVLIRGIHFSKSAFTREQISYMRKTSQAGEPIYSSAVYDISGVSFSDLDLDEDFLRKNAIVVRDKILNLSSVNRNKFQTLYTNQYDKFHSQLKEPSNEYEEIFVDFESSKNPQVSFSEDFLHPYKYSSGQKFLGTGVKKLEPEYDEYGGPKHPYLGKIYVVMIPIDEIEGIDPFFIVSSYARNEIFVSTHFSNNILSEREVSIPSFIPGEYVVYDKAVRVPSFAWEEYQDCYEKKYGITKRSFRTHQTKLEKASFKYENIIQKVIKHNAKKLMEHIRFVCSENDVTIVYRDFDIGFVTELPRLESAIENRNRLIQED